MSDDLQNGIGGIFDTRKGNFIPPLSLVTRLKGLPLLHLGHVKHLAVEPWLSSCRAVEAPSRRCRARCRGLACRACRATVEPVEADSMCRPVELSRSCRVSVEFLCRGCRVYVECAVVVLSSSSLACSVAILHEAL
jgi:hypothetical protein